MGKTTKKRKQTDKTNDQARAPSQTSAKTPKRNLNPLQSAQQTFLRSLSAETRLHFFSPKHVTPEKRAEIWENQADIGEKLVNKYAWATPDARLLKVFQHFGPIVEVGCGSNAYWAKWLNAEGGVDVIAYDESLESGGKINVTNNNVKKRKNIESHNGEAAKNCGLIIRCGGPSSLSTDTDILRSGRTLFLCYPDEEEYHESDSDEDDSDSEHDTHSSKPKSMAAACLKHFTGSTVIHVGELYGDTLDLEQSPWGRSSSREFQERLAAEYHCILKTKLENNWLHVRDTLSVWKRSEICPMAYEEDADGEDESAEEVNYKYVPPEEALPMGLAAPCVAHLLRRSESDEKLNLSENKGQAEKRLKKQDAVLAGNAW